MANIFDSFKSVIFKHYGSNTGKMLLHLGVVGWVLSAAAQVTAIAINDKIPKEKKAFMIPQEIADACVNILSFYLITCTCQSIAKSLVKTGKLLPKSIRDHLAKNKISHLQKGFEVLKDGKLTPDLKDTYKHFYNGVDVVGTTLGTILSCNLITPIVRNKIAASKQKDYIVKMNENSSFTQTQTDYFRRPSMGTFTNSGLKV